MGLDVDLSPKAAATSLGKHLIIVLNSKKDGGILSSVGFNIWGVSKYILWTLRIFCCNSASALSSSMLKFGISSDSDALHSGSISSGHSTAVYFV